MGWTVRGSNPCGSEVFRTRLDRPWGPPSLLYNGYRLFHGGKATGSWRWPPTTCSAEVKERVKLYLHSTFGPSWPVLGWNIPLPLPFTCIHTRLPRFSSPFLYRKHFPPAAYSFTPNNEAASSFETWYLSTQTHGVLFLEGRNLFLFLSMTDRDTYQGEFAKQTATSSPVCLFVTPFVCPQATMLLPPDRILWNFVFGVIIKTCCQILFKINKNMRLFIWRPASIYVICLYSRERRCSLRGRNWRRRNKQRSKCLSPVARQENERRHLALYENGTENTLFPLLRGRWKKYGTARE